MIKSRARTSVSAVIATGHQLNRRSFNVAQDTLVYMLLKECGHVLARPPPNVVRAIKSRDTLRVHRVHSHLYLEPSICDQITQDIWCCKQGLHEAFSS